MVKPKKEGTTTKKSKKNMDNSRGKKGKNNKLNTSRVFPGDGISMSKQLAAKIKRLPRTKTVRLKSSEPRVCGNGKPMPSLAELEKMYEDSDDDGDDSVSHLSQRSKTPDQIIKKDESKVLSPRTLAKLSNKVMEIISNLSDSSIVIADGSVPIVPPPKVNKSGIPYIVGCKDRPRIPERVPTKSTFGKGDPKYGVDYSLLNVKDEEQEDCKKKKRKKSEIPNKQYSTFNAHTDVIATMLRRNEQYLATLKNASNLDKIDTDSDDSNKTINYTDYSPPSKRIRFSPIPSTSSNMEVFKQNDQKFHESLMSNGFSDESSMDETVSKAKNATEKDIEDSEDLQIVETPVETIVVDDISKPSIMDDAVDLCESISEDILGDSKDKINHNPDIEIVTSSPTVDDKSKLEIFEIEDEYEAIDVDKLYSTAQSSVDDCEIIDIDELIAQNNSLMQKYQQNTRDSIITVPDVSFQQDNVTNSTVNPIELVSPVIPCLSNNNINTTISVVVSETTPKQKKKKATKKRTYIFNSTHQNNTSEPVILIPNINSNLSNVNNRFINPVVTPNVSAFPVSNQTVPNAQNSVNHIPSAIPVSPNTSIDSSQKKERDCPICMESISKKPLASTMCGHIFCMECIKAAIKSSGKKCPTCRKKLTGIGYHPLFL